MMEVSAASVRAVPAPGPRVLTALCLGSFTAMLTASAPAPFLPTIADTFGVSVSLVGQITTAAAVLSAALGIVIGPLSDRYGARRLIVIGLAAVALFFLDFSIAPVFPLLFLASIASGLSQATVPGLSLAIAGTHFTVQASTRAIGWTVGALALAPMIGVPILSVTGEAAGWRTAFMLGGVVAVIVTALVARWLPADEAGTSGRVRLGSLLGAYRPLLADRGMRRLYGCSLTRAVCWLGLLTYAGAMLSERRGLSTGEVGLAYMVGGAAYFAGSLAAGGVLARFSGRQMVALSNIVVALLALVVFAGPFGAPVIVGCICVQAFCAAAAWVDLNALIVRETPTSVGTTMVLNTSLLNAGAALGAALGGALLAAGGYGSVAWGLLAFGLLSAALAWFPAPRTTELARGRVI